MECHPASSDKAVVSYHACIAVHVLLNIPHDDADSMGHKGGASGMPSAAAWTASGLDCSGKDKARAWKAGGIGSGSWASGSDLDNSLNLINHCKRKPGKP